MRLAQIFSFFSLFLLAACSSIYCDEPVACEGTPMVLQDLTGLDGCSWVLTDGQHTYEPINLGDFNITPEEGATVYVAIDTLPKVASICMVGPVVKITCLLQETNTQVAY